jgi:hypothetical protein
MRASEVDDRDGRNRDSRWPAPQRPSRPRGSPVLDEIIVTAQKRTHRACRTCRFRDFGVRLGRDLGNLRNRNHRRHRPAGAGADDLGRFNAVQPQIYIRGIGSTDQSASGDQSVGVFIDGVFIGRVGVVGPGLLRPRARRGAARPAGNLVRQKRRRRRDQHHHPTPFRRIRSTLRTGRRQLLPPLGSRPGDRTDQRRSRPASWRYPGSGSDGYSTSANTGKDLSDENNKTVRGQLLCRPMGQHGTAAFGIDWSQDRLAGSNRECLGEQFVFFPMVCAGLALRRLAVQPGSVCQREDSRRLSGSRRLRPVGRNLRGTRDFGALNFHHRLPQR